MVTLPENKVKKPTDEIGKMKVWVYGAPYSGKTTFADSFPDPLILSTDGNTDECKHPSILICDQVSTQGRITNTVMAWNYFKEIVDELAKKQNTYKTIVVDLVDDLYELCRLAKYKDLKITHESDDPFRAWDKIRTEFISTMRKVSNLDYNIVFISHAVTERDITSRDGDNIIGINPNMQEKVAVKLSGMVTMTILATEEKGKYLLHLKTKEGMFGGVRGHNIPDTIPNDFNAFETFYKNSRSE